LGENDLDFVQADRVIKILVNLDYKSHDDWIGNESWSPTRKISVDRNIFYG
jgi:hypothetical protein